MSDKELIEEMEKLDKKYKDMRKLAMKVAEEMDSLVEKYAKLLDEAKTRGLVKIEEE